MRKMIKRLPSSYYEQVKSCPWCNYDKCADWGESVRGFRSSKCPDCGLIFINNRANKEGLSKYYDNYLNDVHKADELKDIQREKMYKLEFDLISRHLKKGSEILDVGCSGGYFLDFFKKAGHKCYGVEFGSAAAEQASKKYPVWKGELPRLKIQKKFDVIIFRGVIEHVADPKPYLAKAIGLLKSKGFIYITSTPNTDAFCCELFKENWTQHTPEFHLMHFKPGHFNEYFKKAGFFKLDEYFFYKETPYADIENDILSVAKAIKIKRRNMKIKFRSKAFYGNMMSLVYQKK